MLKDMNQNILVPKSADPIKDRVEVGKDLLKEKEWELEEIRMRYKDHIELDKNIQDEKNILLEKEKEISLL